MQLLTFVTHNNAVFWLVFLTASLIRRVLSLTIFEFLCIFGVGSYGEAIAER